MKKDKAEKKLDRSLAELKIALGYVQAKSDAAFWREEFEKIKDCAEELVDILSDRNSRKEVDSFTAQPMRLVLAAHKERVEKRMGK